MTPNFIVPHLKNLTDLTIDDEVIMPGVLQTIRINAGKLPSDNRINVFAHVYRSFQPGPCVLLLGGIHGNEINGIEIVRRAVEEKIYQHLFSGTLIMIPLLNVYGFINFTRDVSDGKDVNRSFPGNTGGSLASRVARILTKKILPYIDIAIDFHTGGDARFNYPQIRFTKTDMTAYELAKVFGPRYIISQALIPHSFRKAAFDMHIPTLVYEGGESIRLDQNAISTGLAGIKLVLDTLQMTTFHQSVSLGEQWLIHKTNWVRAATPGMFLWSKCSGDYVHKGEKMGEIKDPYGTKSYDVISNYNGHIIGHNNASVVTLGDALFHVGYEYTKL